MSNPLDKLPTQIPKVKEYDLKTVKARSNALVEKSLQVLEEFLNSDASLKDKASIGFKVLNQHIVILDKVEKLEFMKIHKRNLVLKNNILVSKALEDNDPDNAYKKVEAIAQEDDEPSLNMGWDLLRAGDNSSLN